MNLFVLESVAFAAFYPSKNGDCCPSRHGKVSRYLFCDKWQRLPANHDRGNWRVSAAGGLKPELFAAERVHGLIITERFDSSN